LRPLDHNQRKQSKITDEPHTTHCVTAQYINEILLLVSSISRKQQLSVKTARSDFIKTFHKYEGF
jgi:hypothetical protein